MFIWQQRVNQFRVTDVANCQCDGLLSGSLAGRRSRFCLSLSLFIFFYVWTGLAWTPGLSQTQYIIQ